MQDYWDNYYLEEQPTPIPSQFAVFVMNEFPSINTIVDIGCGDGRDTFFFASHHKFVLGIDGSSEAIRKCETRNNALGNQNLKFVNADVVDLLKVASIISQLSHGPVIFYARFLLHAITAREQKLFMENVSILLREFLGVFAVEFRTIKDSFLTKETPPHFRRYIDTRSFELECEKLRLKVAYSVEGTGLAKYKNDDAHVARFILFPGSGEPHGV